MLKLSKVTTVGEAAQIGDAIVKELRNIVTGESDRPFSEITGLKLGSDLDIKGWVYAYVDVVNVRYREDGEVADFTAIIPFENGPTIILNLFKLTIFFDGMEATWNFDFTWLFLKEAIQYRWESEQKHKENHERCRKQTIREGVGG